MDETRDPVPPQAGMPPDADRSAAIGPRSGGSLPTPDEARDALVDRLEHEIDTASAHADAAIYRLLTAVRAFDAAGGWEIRGAKSPAHWLAYRTNIGKVAARERVRVARALGVFQATDEAMRMGKLSYSKARTITRVMTPENEQQLLEYARTLTNPRLEKVCSAMRRGLVGQRRVLPDDEDRWVRVQYTDDGFARFDGCFYAEEGALIMQALDAIVRREVAARRKARAAPALPTSPGGQGDAVGTTGETGHARARADEATAICALAFCGMVPGVEQDRTAAFVSPTSDCVPGALATCVGPCAPHEVPPGRCSSAWTGGSCGFRQGYEHQPADKTPRFNRADALVVLAESVLANPDLFLLGGIPGVEMVVQVQRDTLSGKSDEPALLPNGSPIPSETARRLACDTSFYVVETDKQGHILDVGRKTRLIHSALRRALELRDKGCRFPGCTEQVWVDGHHIQAWAEGGETNLSNLALLCRRHHLLVHEGGFCMKVEAGALRFYDPRGRYVPAVCEVADPCPASSLDAWLEENGLSDRHSPLPAWYGGRRDWPMAGPPFGFAVHHPAKEIPRAVANHFWSAGASEPLTADAPGGATLPRKRGRDRPS